MGFEAGRTGWTVKGELFAKLVERRGQLPDFVIPPGRHRFSGNVPRPIWLTWWTNSLTGRRDDPVVHSMLTTGTLDALTGVHFSHPVKFGPLRGRVWKEYEQQHSRQE